MLIGGVAVSRGNVLLRISRNLKMLNTEPFNPDYMEIDQYDTCDLHFGQPLGSVCLDCEECICDECFRFIHSSHRRQELADYNRTQLEVLEGNRRKLAEITATSKREVACLKKQIRRCQQKSALAAKEVEAAVKSLFREIEVKKEDIAQNMNRDTSRCIDQLNQQKQELENRLKQFTLICERIDNVAKSTHQGEFFKHVGGLKKHCTGALNQKPLSSPPVFIPQFRINPTLSSECENLQIGMVVNLKDQSDDESEESEKCVYEIEEEWVYEVKPLPVDSLGVSGKDGDMVDEREDGASAGSSYCEHLGSEMNADYSTYQEHSENVSVSSADYTHFSNARLQQKYQSPGRDDKVESACLGISSTESDADIHTSELKLPKHHRQDGDVTREQVTKSRADSTDKGIHTDKTCSSSNASEGHYSLARPTISSKPDHLTLDHDSTEDVYNVIDDHHIGDDEYEHLLPSRDNSPQRVPIDKYDSLQGGIMSPDQNEHRVVLPQKFQLNFNKYEIIPTLETVLHDKILKRVFLPFRITGFATVSRDKDMLLAFVTTDSDVVLIRKNGVEFSRIRELTSPFDVGSSRCFPYNLYITDRGARRGEGSVRVYSCGGEYLDTFAGRLTAPRGIDVATDGQVFVCDQADCCVYGFSPTGRKTFQLNIFGSGFPIYVSVLSYRRLAVSDHARENLIIHDIDAPKKEFLRTKLGGSCCRGMCYEDANQNMLCVVHPEANSLHVVRKGHHEVIELGTIHDTKPLVPLIDESGNVFVF